MVLSRKRELLGAGGARGFGHQRRAVLHQRLVRFVRPVPFQHGEFGVMQRAALAIAEHAGEIENARLARRQQFLAGEFRRGAQIERPPLPAGSDQFGGEGMQMGLVAGRDLQGRGLHLDEIARGKPGPQGGGDPPARPQEGPAAGMDAGKPEWRAFAHIYLNGTGQNRARERLASAEKIAMVRPETAVPRRPQLKDCYREGHR